MNHFSVFKAKFKWIAILVSFTAFVWMCTTSKKGPLPVAEKPFERIVVDKDPPVTPLSPQESMKKVQLPSGYHLELVASEPMIQQPVALAWDGNGRLFVVEMNTYMQDAKGTDEYAPISKIKLLEDTNGDGKMDKATVFIDSLVLPRAILPVGDQLLVQVTDVQNIYAYRDKNGDGKADEKKIVYRNNAIDSRNLEHQNGGFVWNHDNWIYPTRDNIRYKYKNGVLIADTLVDNMIGQWGLTTDNYGRLFYSEAGPGLPAVQIQQMPAYGALNFNDQYSADFTKPWPIIGNLDAQGGLRALRPEDNTLSRFTSGAGQSIFRGDRLPPDMQSDYFIPEMVARVIKRGKVRNVNGKIIIEDAYKEKDWLASADMNFRPVNTYTGPDGTMYIVDMYHGIIQESAWTGADSYLGKVIEQKGLDKNKGMGRIYRVIHDGYQPDKTRPTLLNEPTSKLVTYLDHPNGWWRDNAQQLMVIRQDQSVVPDLKKIAGGEKATLKQKPSNLARIHALWTLEGLGAIDKATLYKAFTDPDAQVRKTAVWISEPFIRQNDAEVLDKLASMKADPSADVRIQLFLSLRSNKGDKTQQTVKELLASNASNELMQYSNKTFLEKQKALELERARSLNLSPADRALVANGKVIFSQLCATCHGADGRGVVVAGAKDMPAPPLVGSARVQGDKIMLTQILLQGLKGPVDGKEYADAMPSMAAQNDEWIASVLSYIRNSSELGNKASTLTQDEVKEVRATTRITPGGTTLRSLETGKLGRAERNNFIGRPEPAQGAGTVRPAQPGTGGIPPQTAPGSQPSPSTTPAQSAPPTRP